MQRHLAIRKRLEYWRRTVALARLQHAQEERQEGRAFRIVQPAQILGIGLPVGLGGGELAPGIVAVDKVGRDRARLGQHDVAILQGR